MDWNEVTATGQGFNTEANEFQPPIEGLTNAQYPMKDPRFWGYTQETLTETLPAEAPNGDEQYAAAEKSAVERDSSPSVPHDGPFKGRRALIGGAFLLALALLSTLSVSFASKQKLTTAEPSTAPLPQPTEKTETEICIEKLTFSVEDLKETWESSTPTVQDAFMYHFSPFDKEGVKVKYRSLWDLLAEQKNAFLTNLPSEDWSEEQKDNFIKRGKLLTAIFGAANERLRALGRLEKTGTTHGIPIPLIDISAGEQWPTFRPSQGEKSATFQEFLEMLPHPRGAYSAFASLAGDAVVPLETAAKLADVIRIDDIESEDDNYTCEHFIEFANSFGFRFGTTQEGELKNAPPLQTTASETPFSTREFLGFLKHRYDQSRQGYVDPLAIKYLAKHWSETRANELTEQILDDQRRRTQDLVQQKIMTMMIADDGRKPSENTLFMLSVFLL
ncbi:hypothetical protein, conserved [Eimeria praecox]|uniref:Uncharacterized protein n=1 Tax=Eimeria praecox TaxID=51316 RepID=U6G158_9EIME|nr:hypothetical protein, conserved [Eimeria praecox]